MDFKHVPVLYEECMENLRIIPDGIYADGTLGGGGHSMGIGRKLGPEGTLIGIDLRWRPQERGWSLCNA